jgi:hypothetical protein
VSCPYQLPPAGLDCHHEYLSRWLQLLDGSSAGGAELTQAEYRRAIACQAPFELAVQEWRAPSAAPAPEQVTDASCAADTAPDTQDTAQPPPIPDHEAEESCAALAAAAGDHGRPHTSVPLPRVPSTLASAAMDPPPAPWEGAGSSGSAAAGEVAVHPHVVPVTRRGRASMDARSRRRQPSRRKNVSGSNAAKLSQGSATQPRTFRMRFRCANLENADSYLPLVCACVDMWMGGRGVVQPTPPVGWIQPGGLNCVLWGFQ